MSLLGTNVCDTLQLAGALSLYVKREKPKNTFSCLVLGWKVAQNCPKNGWYKLLVPDNVSDLSDSSCVKYGSSQQ